MDPLQHRRSKSAPDADAVQGNSAASNPRSRGSPGENQFTEPREGKLAELHDPDVFQSDFQKQKKGTWHTSTVDWHDKWPDNNWSNGRLLLVDYIRRDRLSAGKMKIVAQEMSNVHELHKFYSDQRKCRQAALRVIHVQNAPWATFYLINKFHIDDRDNLVGMDFAKWLKHTRPEWRGSKPILKGKTWRTQRDPWRGVRRTALGMDYLKPCNIRTTDDETRAAYHNADAKMMELNDYDDQNNPIYTHDVFVQRLSAYIQFRDGAVVPDDDKNPYSQATPLNGQPREQSKGNKNEHQKSKLPPLDTLDNGNTIIIFEKSQTGSVKDTLIGSRQQIESRWRRLSFFLLQKDLGTDTRLALACMDLVLEDLFSALAISWEHFLSTAETHVSILEDKIYESPADESRAPELWHNSSLWLKVERLLYIHQDIVKSLTTNLNDLSENVEDTETKTNWLDTSADDWDKLLNLAQQDLISPTANLNDLLYKSVGIRDSRHSLQLNTSMWRLSWITFIFLPLTFVVGFFGMNVDTFQNDPSIKWYFIAAVPLMTLVLILWYVLKHGVATRRQTPYQRGVYEHMFHDLAEQHPDLWTRSGPRRYIKPEGFYSSIKWRLLNLWFDPDKTVRKPSVDPDEDDGASGLGSWARLKRMLARQWLGSIKTRPYTQAEIEAGQTSGLLDTDLSAVQELVALTTPQLVAEAEPATGPVTRPNLEKLSPPPGDRLRDRSRSSHSAGRASGGSQRPSSSGGSSGWMVEERDIAEDEHEEEERSILGGIRRSIDGVINL